MNKTNKLLIIIPAYNEETTIKPVISKLISYIKDNKLPSETSILVINDCSNDNTLDCLNEFEVKVITNFTHLGYCGSLQVGYRYALQNEFNYVIQMDADGQHDPYNVLKIYDCLTKNKDLDIVIGSRFLYKNNQMKVSLIKNIAIKYFKSILKISTSKEISDPTSGLQGLSIPVVYYYSQFNQFDDRYPDSNILIEAILAGFNYKEIPALMYNRADGKSMHTGLKPLYYMIHVTISALSAWSRRDLKNKYLEAKNFSYEN